MSEHFETEKMPEPIEVDGMPVIVKNYFTVGYNGERITGTVVTVEELVDEMGNKTGDIQIELKDISAPETYRNKTGTFVYSMLQNRWQS